MNHYAMAAMPIRTIRLGEFSSLPSQVDRGSYDIGFENSRKTYPLTSVSVEIRRNQMKQIDILNAAIQSPLTTPWNVKSAALLPVRLF